MALKALMQNRLQALLTLCGMSIGVAMVVIVSGLGRGAQQQIEVQIESAGPTLITIRSGNFVPPAISARGSDSSGGEVSQGAVGGDGLSPDFSIERNAAVREARRLQEAPRKVKSRSPAWPLEEREMELLTQRIDDVRAVAGSLAGNVTLDPGSGITARIARVHGFQPTWPDIEGWELVEGRFISDREHDRGAPVMLVSADVAGNLWRDASPLKQSLNIGGETVRVVGVIEDGADPGSSIIVPVVYVPLDFAQTVLKRDYFDVIHVRSSSVGTTTRVAESITGALRELRELPEDTVNDFRVQTQSVSAMPSMGTDPRLARAVHSNVIEFEQASWEQMAASLRQAGRTFSLLLGGAAAVSLVVGGIGVMNIMLVSVASRTREIGLRMALGARMKDVMAQFILEAVTLAVLGGLLGLLLGTAGLFAVRHLLDWATAVSPVMLLIAVAMAALTGIVFGYGPASRAARLEPVVALRTD